MLTVTEKRLKHWPGYTRRKEGGFKTLHEKMKGNDVNLIILCRDTEKWFE